MPKASAESQAWLQSIFRAAPTGIGLVRDRVIHWANETLCRMVGYAEEELIGRSARILYATDADFARVGEEKYAQIRAGGRGTVETRWQRKDKVVRDILLSSAPVDPADWAKGVIFTALDITERKRTEADLRTRSEQLEAVRATAADITGELDLATVLGLVARRACELTGATAADIDLWDADRQLLVPEASYGHEFGRPATTRRLGEGAMGTVAQTRRGLMIHDYRASALAHPETLAHTKITASIVEPLLCRDALLGVIGVDHEAPGRAFTDHDQAALRLFAAHAAIAIQNARLYDAAQRELRQREAAEATLRRSMGQLEAVRATTADITRELDLDRLLRLITARAAALLGVTHGVVHLWDETARLLVTRAVAGYDAWRLGVTLRLGEGVAGTVAQRRAALIENEYRTSPLAAPIFVEHTTTTAMLAAPLLYRDHLLGVLAVTNDGGGRRFAAHDLELLGLFADQAAIAIANARLFQNQQQAFVELEQAQDELIRSEKLRGLGQMAAGIAHDLNNTLAAILGQAELLRLRVREPELQDGLRALLTATTDGAQVVRRLQDFARQRGTGPLTPCNLSDLVTETLEITRPRWREELRRKGIVIEVAVDLTGLPLVQGNPAEIREVLINLIFNAVDAMPGGGSLRFSGCIRDGRRAQPPEGPSAAAAPQTAPAEPPQWVEIAVTDTGIGMTEEVRRRAFDPFFTTKGLHGTGLGLSAAYGIMERHGGQIDITSAPGRGATFRLRFRPASEAAGLPLPVTPPATPSRRILLVDDDAAVLHTLAALLRASGQEVVEANSGAAAIDWLKTTPVDLVLTDLGMPQVTGWDVARAAKARRPDLPVVLLTGWGEQMETEAATSAGVDRVLTKPVPRSVVLAAIAELTGQR